MTTNNHPAHGPVSLDRLHQISEILSKAADQSDGGNLGYAMADAVKVIDSAIAAFGAEPVAYMVIDADSGEKYIRPDRSYFEGSCQPLYTAPVVPELKPVGYLFVSDQGAVAYSPTNWGIPGFKLIRQIYGDMNVELHPAPVVPDEMTMDEAVKILNVNFSLSNTGVTGYIAGYNSCRAAMLQGTDGKPELTVWYGSMPETNGKTNWTAMLHRKGQHPWEGITIDRSEYHDRVRYEADRMRHLIGELPDEPDILSYDADSHSGYVKPGNYPVSPDGWIPVSERMPEGMKTVITSNGFDIGQGWWDGECWKSFDCHDVVPGKVTHWMPLPAAPQPEVKRNDAQP
ncbi:DUF551 domain-containing protein [Salmonella enterica]|nr:DUF551 domain-containing protein [Salmonella enterica]EBJ1501914.1 DUF551 domain-containing protein [Salmonella enterica]EGX5005979.1 DUF551 domain-containing protein [Salmonella enterica]